jgi:cytosine/adenosine deaminase-related metal-dependent hydrolase
MDAHYHMDTGLSIGNPRHNESGTLLEGIRLWGEVKPHLTQKIIAERALRYCDWAVGRGLPAIRSHDGAMRAAGPGDRLAPSRPCTRWTTTTSAS